MLTSIGAVLKGAPAGPAPQPVRRGSHQAGRCEALFWQPTSRQEVRRVVLAARRFDLLGRKAGRRNGPLGHIALEVLELLAHLVSYRTGRLEPSVAFLMQKLRRSKSAIYHALHALKAHGFLDWLRRYEPTGREGRGPQLRQTSNAYRLALPAQALRCLGRLLQAPPLPEDVSHAQELQASERAAHRASLPLDELPLVEVEDHRLGQLLARLGRSVQERESGQQTESQAKKNT